MSLLQHLVNLTPSRSYRRRSTMTIMSAMLHFPHFKGNVATKFRKKELVCVSRVKECRLTHTA